MDVNRVQQLIEKIKHSQNKVGSLMEEYGSLLLKSTDTTGDSEHSVKPSPLVEDGTKQLMDIDVAMESIQQQVQLALKKYLSTQSSLSTSEDCSTSQSDDNQTEDVNFTINQQGKLSDYNKGQNAAKLNPKTAHELQALFSGTLPDDFFLHLMSVIGIQECLISNRLVCSFWNELVLDRCHNQKSLKLFETFNCLIEYGELLLKYEKTQDASLILKSIGDDLLVEGLEIDHEQLIKSLHQEDEEGDIQKECLTREKKLEASKVMTALFPEVEDLVLCPEHPTLINIEHLLQFYAEQLTSLTMTYFGSWRECPSSKLRALSFPLLKALNTFNFSPQDSQLLSLLPQLESLTLERSNISLETLLRTGTRLQELNIDYIHAVYTAPMAEFSKRPRINSNLRKFSFDDFENVFQILEFTSLNLTSLECLKLDLRFDQDNFPHLYLLCPYLVPLHQLHSLTLQARVSFFLLDDNQLDEIQPLYSVRHLKLLLWDYDSFPLGSIDLFSRALFTAFPNAEQVLITFVGHEGDDDGFVYDGLVDTDTFSSFESFAGKHPNVVQLFRSKGMSKFTNLPNAVSPLLGHRRQVYEEYIEEEELFGVAICKLTASLVPRQAEDGLNLKIILRPADRLTAMSNLLQLVESKAFAFTFEMAKTMIEHMVHCALKYDTCQVALFTVTCKCVLSLLERRLVDMFNSVKEKSFLVTEELKAQYPFFVVLLNLVEHHKTQQFNDKELLFQLFKRMVLLLEEFASIWDGNKELDEFKIFKILLKLADYYQTEKLSVLDNEEKLLLQIRNLIDEQLQMFENDPLDAVIIKFVRSKNRVYRVEMIQALLRCCESTDDSFKWLSNEGDSDSSDRDSTTSDGSSAESEPDL